MGEPGANEAPAREEPAPELGAADRASESTGAGAHRHGLSSWRTWRLVILLAALAWVVYLLFFGPRGYLGELPVPDLTPPQPAAQADYRWTLYDLGGKPVSFERYKGKAVFLNLWATWCAPCVEEMPSIANLAANPRLKEVAFVCVSSDENPEDVRRFLREKKLSLPVLRATEAPEVFLREGLPTTFLIAPDGRIVDVEDGPARWDDPSVVDFLEKLARPVRTP